MDLFESLGIKIPNAVLVSGTPTIEIEEVEEFLLEYGAVERSLTINSPNSEYNDMLVVEFKTGAPFDLLGPILPYIFKPANNEYCVKSLAKVYAASVGCTKTNNYLADLKQVAKLSGQEFTEVLQVLMAQINDAVTELCPVKLETSKRGKGGSPRTQNGCLPYLPRNQNGCCSSTHPQHGCFFSNACT